MLFRQAFIEGIAAGRITTAFRRWRRPTVKPGGTLRTSAGVLAIDAVERVHGVSEDEARRAGHASLAALMEELDARPDGDLYRIDFRLAGADPRAALRKDSAIDAAEIATRLARLDKAANHGPWTARVLRLIAENPGRRAPDLAALMGLDTQPFKRDVRKLKELGLTESLEVGYRISPRGKAYMSTMP